MRQLEHRIESEVTQLIGTILNCVHAFAQLLLLQVVAGLTRLLDVEQRAAHVMVADLHRTLALVRHMAVGAGYAGTGMNALAVQLELGMLSFQSGRTTDRMGPIL